MKGWMSLCGRGTLVLEIATFLNFKKTNALWATAQIEPWHDMIPMEIVDFFVL